MKKLYETLIKWVGLILTHVIEYPNIWSHKSMACHNLTLWQIIMGEGSVSLAISGKNYLKLEGSLPYLVSWNI